MRCVTSAAEGKLNGEAIATSAFWYWSETTFIPISVVFCSIIYGFWMPLGLWIGRVKMTLFCDSQHLAASATSITTATLWRETEREKDQQIFRLLAPAINKKHFYLSYWVSHFMSRSSSYGQNTNAKMFLLLILCMLSSVISHWFPFNRSCWWTFNVM